MTKTKESHFLELNYTYLYKSVSIRPPECKLSTWVFDQPCCYREPLYVDRSSFGNEDDGLVCLVIKVCSEWPIAIRSADAKNIVTINLISICLIFIWC